MTVLVATYTTVVPAYAAGTGSIGGTISDEGAPVAGAMIEVSSEDGAFWGTTYTDSAGHYQVLNVPEAASAYRVMIDAAGHPTQYAYGKTEWSLANLFSVVAGQRTTVDDTLLPTGTITGRFTDSAGNGVSAWVYGYDDTGSSSASGYTDAEGYFSIRALPGTYRVRFSYGNGYQYAYGTTDYWRAATFTVTVGATVTVNDVKLDGGSIAGRVTNADGTPAVDVTVEAHGYNVSDFTTTDEAGAYRIDDLPPGDYKLSYQLPSGSMEWAHRARTEDSAQTFTVAANAVTTVDEQLLPTGAIEGRFTDSDGAPMSGVSVYANYDGSEFPISTSTDADGRYRIDNIFVGVYQVQFRDWRIDLRQFAYGKLSAETADPITVNAGQTTTVNDSRLAFGSIRFTARDSVTGAPINNFFVNILEQWGSTENGTLVLSNVPAGTRTASAGAEGYAYADNAATVTVLADRQIDVVLSLRPVGRITTTVTDKSTGAPVAGICVLAAKPTGFSFPDGCPARSDAAGAVTIEVRDPGTYQLFALPDRGSPYGAQWVGAGGGTGTQTKAEPVTVAAGQTVPAESIRLDQAGIIAGKVTSETGAPFRLGTVGVVGPDLGAGADKRYSPIAADGVYVIDWLGPYHWPLLFGADGHAYQWSGGEGNRLDAELVRVKKDKDKANSFNYTLKQGTELIVTVPDGAGECRIVSLNAVTGDPMGVRDTSGSPARATLQVIGPQDVKVWAICQTGSFWYGGTDFASATTVQIPTSGPIQVIFTSD